MPRQAPRAEPRVADEQPAHDPQSNSYEGSRALQTRTVARVAVAHLILQPPSDPRLVTRASHCRSETVDWACIFTPDRCVRSPSVNYVKRSGRIGANAGAGACSGRSPKTVQRLIPNRAC